jgi:microcystin-dependent protein
MNVDCYLGEIRIFAGAYAPEDWSFCEGQLLNIADHQDLYAAIGSTYGGDGRVTFALPDLRGRLVCGSGQGPGLSNYALGETFGEAMVDITIPQMPIHTHAMVATPEAATGLSPQDMLYAATESGYVSYVASAPPRSIDRDPTAEMISHVGAGQEHCNLMPCLAVNYIIAIKGHFPS